MQVCFKGVLLAAYCGNRANFSHFPSQQSVSATLKAQPLVFYSVTMVYATIDFKQIHSLSPKFLNTYFAIDWMHLWILPQYKITIERWLIYTEKHKRILIKPLPGGKLVIFDGPGIESSRLEATAKSPLMKTSSFQCVVQVSYSHMHSKNILHMIQSF